jgi:hypothetical protein
MPGIATSAVEVTNISKHGFWMLIEVANCFFRSKSSRGSSRPPSRRSYGSNALRPGICGGPTSTSI